MWVRSLCVYNSRTSKMLVKRFNYRESGFKTARMMENPPSACRFLDRIDHFDICSQTARKEVNFMCPYYNPSRSECRVTPWDSSAHKDDYEANTKCKDSYAYKNCGNYEAAQRGEYRIER